MRLEYTMEQRSNNIVFVMIVRSEVRLTTKIDTNKVVTKDSHIRGEHTCAVLGQGIEGRRRTSFIHARVRVIARV